MLRVIYLLLSFVIMSTSVSAYELVLPKEKKSVSNSNYAFFVGKANNSESILINNERVFTASNGAFAHSVRLKDGENRIVIRSNYNTQIYTFHKKKKFSVAEERLCEFDIKRAVVKKDNTPLRNTPVDAGLNRVSHLFKDTTVLINGSKAGFYRVFLSKDKTAWIAKSDVNLDCDNEFAPAEFITTSSRKFKNASVQNISFSRNIPYTVEDRENELIFKVYNPELSEDCVYTLNIQKPEKYKYHITLENGAYSFKVEEVSDSLKGLVIAVDPGHGGNEKGALGCLGDNEKDINLKIALELEKILSSMGAKVFMTRSCDANISLSDRVEFAKKNDAEIFVSIHLNSIGDIPMNVHKNRGTSVYYYNNNSKNLAEIVEKSVTKTAGTRNDGVRTASFAVIRPHDYVGILVETAYMTNPLDSVLYSSENFAHNTAKGIAEGIAEFVNR